MLAKKFVLASQAQGRAPKTTDFKIEHETLPALKDGEILCKAEWLSVDPYMRGVINRLCAGDALIGTQVARVLQSRCPAFPEGCQVVGSFGWRDLTIHQPKDGKGSVDSCYLLPDMKGLPASYALGSVGMPGVTALFGLTKLCEPKVDEVLLVSSAAGAVGSLVGQIGKIKGCRVLGLAGNAEKVKWLKEELGFDEVFNYKTGNLNVVLRRNAPKGIDCYFDSVGGDISFNVHKNMNNLGRIALCGAITTYNNDLFKPPSVPMDYMSLIYKNVRMEGFMVYRWSDEWFEALDQLRDWIVEGKLKVEETVTTGFSNMPKAFVEMLEGKNKGKAVVKA